MNRSWSEGFERRRNQQRCASASNSPARRQKSNANSRPSSQPGFARPNSQQAQMRPRINSQEGPGFGSPVRPSTSPNALVASNSLPNLDGDQRPHTAPEGFEKSKKQQRFEAFCGRQNTFTQDVRTKTSLFQRQVLQRDQDEERAVPVNWRLHGVAGFRKFLRKRFGTLPAAWRLGVDKASRGHLSFGEFCGACRFLGFAGELKQVWDCLDTQLTGFTSLAQIDPAADRGLREFGVLLKEQYGSIEAAWKEALDPESVKYPESVHKLDEKDFCERAAEVGYQGNTKKLFRWMLNDMSMLHAKMDNGKCHVVKVITLSELEAALKHHQERVKEENSLDDPTMMSLNSFGLNSASDSEGYNSSDQEVHRLTKNARWSIDLGRKHRMAILLEGQGKIEKDVGMKTLDELKNILVIRYGSLWKGWREVFDRDGNGRVSWSEFSMCLRDIGYAGNFKALWEALDQECCGFVSFRDVDHQIHDAIHAFKQTLRDKYGNLLSAWYRVLDTHRNSRVDEHRFVDCCDKIGFEGNPRWLFRLFQPEPGRKFLTLRDFDTQAFNALGRGDFRMISEKHGKRPDLSIMTFNERQEQNFSAQWNRALAEAQREGLKEVKDMLSKREIGAGSLAGFKGMLIRKFGTLPAAWRNHLDIDQNGKLSFAEFCCQVRNIGYVGNLKQLWRELDEDNSGFIALRELDPDADREMRLFREMLNEKYGNVMVAWKKCLDISRNGNVEEDEFIQQSAVLGYKGDAKQLYKWFLKEPGRRFLTMGDIDPEVMAAIYRGDHRMLTKKAIADERHAPPLETSQSAEDLGSRRGSKSPKSRRQSKDGDLEDFGEDDGEESTLSPSRRGSKRSGSRSPSRRGSLENSTTMNAEWSEELGKRKRAEAKKFQEEKLAKRMGATNLNGFKRDLIVRYGSIVTAWRQALDTDGNGRLSFGEFCMALRDLSFNGNLKALWADLHSEGGLISLKDLDENSANGLEQFRTFALEKFDNLMATWYKGLDLEGNIRLQGPEFVERCAALGFQGNAKRTFKMLLPEPGKKHIVVEDLETLLIGVPTGERQRMWMGEKKPPKLVKRQSIEVRSLEGFKKLLIRHFGSIYAGWRKGLDPDNFGMVTKSGFAKTCRTIGFMGNGNALWNLLDENKDGIISLSELDKDVGEKIGNFIRFMKEKYGNLLKAWKEGLDVDGNKRLDKEEFVKRCKELGYPGNAKELFHLLKPEVGRTHITLDDLGDDAKQALHHGMELAHDKHGQEQRYNKRASYF